MAAKKVSKKHALKPLALKRTKKAPKKSAPKALKTKTPKRSAKRMGKTAPRAQKPRSAPSTVKKGQIYIDNEERAGGPRKLAVEQIIREESQPDRHGNPKADRRYAECRVIQNDVEQGRRVRIPLGRLVAPAYTLEGASETKAGAQPPVEIDNGDDSDDDGSEE